MVFCKTVMLQSTYGKLKNTPQNFLHSNFDKCPSSANWFDIHTGFAGLLYLFWNVSSF